MPHDPTCTGCEHECPWRQNPLGAPFCGICDDHSEAAYLAVEEDEAEEREVRDGVFDR